MATLGGGYDVGILGSHATLLLRRFGALDDFTVYEWWVTPPMLATCEAAQFTRCVEWRQGKTSATGTASLIAGI